MGRASPSGAARDGAPARKMACRAGAAAVTILQKSVQGGERGGERRYFGLAQAGGCTGDQCFVECRVAFQRGPRGRCQRHRHAALVPAAAGADEISFLLQRFDSHTQRAGGDGKMCGNLRHARCAGCVDRRLFHGFQHMHLGNREVFAWPFADAGLLQTEDIIEYIDQKPFSCASCCVIAGLLQVNSLKFKQNRLYVW